MTKKFTINCDFNGRKIPVTLYVGNPSLGSHPLNFQNRWLADNRGISIPKDIMESFGKISEIAERNRVPFENLCEYVIEEINLKNSLENDIKKSHSISDMSLDEYDFDYDEERGDELEEDEYLDNDLKEGGNDNK